MPIFRTHKDKNFTVVDLDILKNKNLSYGAKGLLITCLSLPEDWEFSIRGLAALSSNKVTATENLLTELRDNGYLQIAQTRINGRFDYVYSFYERPITVGDFTDTEKPIRKNRYGKTDTDNQALYSIKDTELRNKELKDKECKDDINTPLPPKGKKKSILDQNLDTLIELMGGYNFSQPISAKLVEWYTYKAEQKKTITPTGMKTQLNKVSTMITTIGEDKVIYVLDESMANNYQGMIWDLANKGKGKKEGLLEGWDFK